MASTQLMASVPSGIEPFGPFGTRTPGSGVTASEKAWTAVDGSARPPRAATRASSASHADWSRVRRTRARTTSCSRLTSASSLPAPTTTSWPTTGPSRQVIRCALRSAPALTPRARASTPLARAGETAPSARLAALAWTPSRATRAWLTIRSFGLPADFTTVVEARAPEPAWRLTSCSHAEAGAEPTVSPATSPAPRTAERDATTAAEAEAGAAQRERHGERPDDASSQLDARHLHRCNVGNGAVMPRASLNSGPGPDVGHRTPRLVGSRPGS